MKNAVDEEEKVQIERDIQVICKKRDKDANINRDSESDSDASLLRQKQSEACALWARMKNKNDVEDVLMDTKVDGYRIY